MKSILPLDHKVQKVDWSLITRDPRIPDKVLVECIVKGQTKVLFADYVVCTLPLGYLKAHHDTIFYPRLDSRKVYLLLLLDTLFFFGYVRACLSHF